MRASPVFVVAYISRQTDGRKSYCACSLAYDCATPQQDAHLSMLPPQPEVTMIAGKDVMRDQGC